jgi:hypothetical protein
VLITNLNADIGFLKSKSKLIDHVTFSTDVISEYSQKRNAILSNISNLATTSKNAIFLFAVGPLSEILIDVAYRTNPINTYIDIGSAFDPYLFGKTTRPYQAGDYSFHCEFQRHMKGRQALYNHPIVFSTANRFKNFLRKGRNQTRRLLKK